MMKALWFSSSTITFFTNHFSPKMDPVKGFSMASSTWHPELSWLLICSLWAFHNKRVWNFSTQFHIITTELDIRRLHLNVYLARVAEFLSKLTILLQNGVSIDKIYSKHELTLFLPHKNEINDVFLWISLSPCGCG